MENSNKNNSVDFQADSLHSQICLVDNIDFIYRKAYKGDWGHWDDLPDTLPSNANCGESSVNENSISGSESPNENSYL
jgi:hypothetical protein